MLFSSQIFILLFLPVTVGLYYVFAKHDRVRIWFLILASLVFYGYWDYRFIPLLIASILINYSLSLLYRKIPLKILIIGGITFNLSLIIFFKYFNFLAENLVTDYQPWDIILPLGISFFTLQQVSYLVDLHKGRVPRYEFSHYFLYVVVFPHLIAGPIIRHNELIAQFKLSPLRKGLHERLSRGATLFTLGLAKKVLIADQMALIVDPLFSAASNGSLTFAEAWLAALAYSMQIYFDFSGYSEMAIGLGLLLGLMLPVNFDRPYSATSMREFWRRWHMTLSRFLRDYLYIPLGGNRFGLTRQILAVLFTMTICGLWHGAGWTYVLWGFAHGLAVAVNNVWKKFSVEIPKNIGWLLTFTFVTFTWVIFRAENIEVANSVMNSMVGLSGLGFEINAEIKRLWLLPVALFFSIYGMTFLDFSLNKMKPNKYLASGLAVLLIYIVLELGKGQLNEFIYFQF